AATIRIDATVMTFTLIVSLLTGVSFGLAPALTASKLDLTVALKESGRSGGGSGRRGLRNALVTLEVALSLLLLAGAGLLIRGFLRVEASGPRFPAEELVRKGIPAPPPEQSHPHQRS